MTDADRIKAIVDLVQKAAHMTPSFQGDDAYLGKVYDIGFTDGMIVMGRLIYKLINDTQERA